MSHHHTASFYHQEMLESMYIIQYHWVGLSLVGKYFVSEGQTSFHRNPRNSLLIAVTNTSDNNPVIFGMKSKHYYMLIWHDSLLLFQRVTMTATQNLKIIKNNYFINDSKSSGMRVNY